MSKLIVKQPFFDELEENKNKQEQEKNKQEIQEIQENKEEQEKPIADPTIYQSEETHGGDESTNSIKNSPNPSSNSNSNSNSNNEEENNKINEQNTNNEQNDNSMQSGNSDQQTNSNSNSNETANEQNENNENNNNESNFQETEGTNDAENNNNEHENQETEENNEENNEDEEDEYNKNENNKQIPSGQYNTRQVVDLTSSENSAYAKYYQTEFYRFIEIFAEEKIKIFDNKHPEEYNIKKLIFRKYEKKHLNYYKGNKIKDTVILILDNSGSMEWWSKNLRILSLIALQRDDITIYIAPNGDIQYMITKYSNYIPVYHPEVLKSLINKKIIYVGDFDGANTPIMLSWHNDVVWICPETRYRRFLSHNWVHYSEDKFNGVFIRAYNLDEMFQGLKKITRYLKLFIDFHINDKFQDD